MGKSSSGSLAAAPAPPPSPPGKGTPSNGPASALSNPSYGPGAQPDLLALGSTVLGPSALRKLVAGLRSGVSGVLDAALLIRADHSPDSEPWLPGLCQALSPLNSLDDIKRFLGALFLSECVYKEPAGDITDHLTLFQSELGPVLAPIRKVQLSLPHVQHRYLLGEGNGQLWVTFAGTKGRRDLFADANLSQSQLWDEAGGRTAERPDSEEAPGSPAAAHSGFLSRAKGVPIEEIYHHALSRGLHLVLCGHSLGGAVAKLCTLRLLRQLPEGSPSPPITCITFACTAVGNKGLATMVDARGWGPHFRNYLLPEDVVPRLLGMSLVAKKEEAGGMGTPGPQSGRPRRKEEGGPAAAEAGGSSQEEGGRFGYSTLRRLLSLVSLLPQPQVSAGPPPSGPAAGQAADEIEAAVRDEAQLAATAEEATAKQMPSGMGLAARWRDLSSTMQAAAGMIVRSAVPSYALFGHQHFLLASGAVNVRRIQPPPPLQQQPVMAAVAEDLLPGQAAEVLSAQRRSLLELRNGFIHHRMFSYRARVMAIICAAPGVPYGPRAAPNRPGPAPVAVVLSSSLAPRVTPLAATAMAPLPAASSPPPVLPDLKEPGRSSSPPPPSPEAKRPKISASGSFPMAGRRMPAEPGLLLSQRREATPPATTPPRHAPIPSLPRAVAVDVRGVGVHSCSNVTALLNGHEVPCRRRCSCIPSSPAAPQQACQAGGSGGSGSSGPPAGMELLPLSVDLPPWPPEPEPEEGRDQPQHASSRLGVAPELSLQLRLSNDFFERCIDVTFEPWRVLLLSSPTCTGAAPLTEALQRTAARPGQVPQAGARLHSSAREPVLCEAAGVQYVDLTINATRAAVWRGRLYRAAHRLQGQSRSSILPPVKGGLSAARRYGWQCILAGMGLAEPGQALRGALSAGMGELFCSLAEWSSDRVLAAQARLLAMGPLLAGGGRPPLLSVSGEEAAAASVQAVVLLHDAMDIGGQRRRSMGDEELLRDTAHAARFACIPVLFVLIGWEELTPDSKAGAVGLLRELYSLPDIRSSNVIGMGRWIHRQAAAGEPGDVTTTVGVEVPPMDVQRLHQAVKTLLVTGGQRVEARL